ncbi:MAG: Fe-S cluster assembly protein SufB [Candidatus Woesearchaeota archaeon]
MNDVSKELQAVLDAPSTDRYRYRAPDGVSEELVRSISTEKGEPSWMLDLRLRALKIYSEKPMPEWGPDLSGLDLDGLTYYVTPDAKSNAASWDEVPDDIKKVYDALGIPQAEQKALAGAGAQFDSGVVYHQIKKEWEEKGVIFLDMDVALREHEELVKRYFGTVVSPALHKFSALHYAVWSGGTFIYVPKGVDVPLPLQAYFRMNARKMGQFEHTLIIVDDGARLMYIEGCSAPQYNESSIHAGCVEVYVGRGARARYSSVENWSRNTYNLNTKSAHVHEDGVIEWIGGNLGCLTGDALVETVGGPRRIDEIEVGDHVYALDETDRSIKPRRVLGSVFSGIKEVYVVTVSGRRLRATANHPFLVMERVKRHPSHKKGFFNATWKPLAYLRAGDLIAVPRRLPDEGTPYRLPQPVRGSFARSNNQYGDFIMRTGSSIRQIRVPDHTSEDFMWFLGLMLGDGHVWFDKSATKAKINIAIPRSSDLRTPLIETLESLFDIREFYEQERYIVVNSIQLGLLLEEIGFVGNADTKSVPRWVHTLPRSQKLAFLAGYFDSDGHVGRNGIYLTSINEDVLRSIQHVALSCGMGFSHVFNHGIERETTICGVQCMAHESFRLLLNGPLVGELPTRSHSYRESITRIKTKRNFTTANGVNFRHETSDDLGFTRVQSVEAAGIEPTYDIEVEGSHNFIANGIIVHNSGVTMLYPSSILKGARAKSDHISIAFAAKDQNQDVGAKVFMLAPNTAATITSKSISLDGGITSYRGVVKVSPKATGANLSVECDALMMDNRSESNTYPVMDIQNDTATITHEATVGKISEEEVFYLMSRGIPEEQAVQMIVSGFIEPVIKELPLEYAVELNRLIALEMEGSLG